MDFEMNKEGEDMVRSVRVHLDKEEYQRALAILKDAMKKFRSAIKTAEYNCHTRFKKKYEDNLKHAKELSSMITRLRYSELGKEKVMKKIQKPEEESHPQVSPKKDETAGSPEEREKEIRPAAPKAQSPHVPKKISPETITIPEIEGDIKIQLGRDEMGYRVEWIPKLQANQHMAAVGMSGTGKTTVVRTILHQLKEQQVPLIIFDLHDDFSAERTINFSQITINPLELDGLNPKEKAIEFAYICKRIFQLGDQQENKLREAVLKCYAARGIDTLDKSTYANQPPTLYDVNEYLEANRDGKTIDTLLGRVKFFHRIDLFMSETRCPFQELFRGSTVIKLIEFSDNPDLQTALCEIFLNKLLFTVKKAGQSKLRSYCVIDEAHILDDGKDSYRSPLVKIAREARKYGLGLILASQMPKDFSKSVLHNTATIISLKFNANEEARAVAQQMYGITESDILSLGEKGEGYVKLGGEVVKVRFFRKDDL